VKTTPQSSWNPSKNVLVKSLEGQHGALGLLDGTSTVRETDVVATVQQAALGLVLLVLSVAELGEAPLVGDDDVLATRELETGTTQSLHDVSLVGLLGAHGQDDLADVDTGDSAIRLAVGTTHTSLQTIGTGARQHLVDAQHVEGVEANAQVEGILAAVLGHVLVHHNTGSFQSLGRDLLVLAGDQVHAQLEVLDGGVLASDIIDLNLGVRNTTAVTRLDVRLVLAIAVAAGRTTSHLGRVFEEFVMD